MRGEDLRSLRRPRAEVLTSDQTPRSRDQLDSAKKDADVGWRKSLPNEKVFEDAIEAAGDAPPAYRYKWDLAADTNVTRGVMYMAELNPDQPAAMVMAGVIATQERSYHLAVMAYQRAIDLGSPQADLLRWHISALELHIRQSLSLRQSTTAALWLAWFIVFGTPILAIVAWRAFRRNA